MADEKKKLTCESTMCCKATAQLGEDVKQDMEKCDASLKDLLENDDKKSKEDETK